MSDWERFLEESPTASATQRVMDAADKELAQLRKSRRKFVFGGLAPAMMAIAGVLTWHFVRRSENEMAPDVLVLMEISEETDEHGIELLEEFETIADLEVLEQWTSS